MLREDFYGTAGSFKWVKEDAVYQEPIGYAHYIFSYDSKLPEAAGKHVIFEGISQFTIKDGLITCYREVFDRGIPLTQLNFPPERIAKSLKRWTNQLLESDRAKGM